MAHNTYAHSVGSRLAAEQEPLRFRLFATALAPLRAYYKLRILKVFPMRMAWIYACLVCWLFAGQAWAFAPRAACWRAGGTVYVAALEGGQVRVARVAGERIEEIGVFPARDITLLADGQWHGDGVLLGARGAALVRWDIASSRWVTLGSAPGPIREMLPAGGTTASGVLLTGHDGTPVPSDGAVYWCSWKTAFTCARVQAIKDYYHPWQIWWSGVAGERRLAVATYKATKFAPFAHNCLFLFAWKAGDAEARWLGSRLKRPYVDAAHADVRRDGNVRLAAVEITRAGGRGLSIYAPIQFGYAGEWHSEDIPGLERVAAFGLHLVCWGHDAHHQPCAWQIMLDGDSYRLDPLPVAPPALEMLAAIAPEQLAGYWNGAWRVIGLAK